MINADSIHVALNYVHYWEATERGESRKGRVEACKDVLPNLNPEEQEILLRAINVGKWELEKDTPGYYAEFCNDMRVKYPNITNTRLRDLYEGIILRDPVKMKLSKKDMEWALKVSEKLANDRGEMFQKEENGKD